MEGFSDLGNLSSSKWQASYVVEQTSEPQQDLHNFQESRFQDMVPQKHLEFELDAQNNLNQWTSTFEKTDKPKKFK